VHAEIDDPTTDQHRTESADPLRRLRNTPGHPHARGTLPLARYLTDPAIEDEIQALAAEAPPMTEDQRAKLARLLRIGRSNADRSAA
jgi:hypothetical protein